jgi:hypothetical protein
MEPTEPFYGRFTLEIPEKEESELDERDYWAEFFDRDDD